VERVRVVMVDTLPIPGTDGFETFGGARINVYTTELSEDGAHAIAAREVAEAGWHVQSVEGSFLLARADLAEAPEGLQYFEQALLDGIVLVIHAWRRGDEDAVH